MEEEEVEIDILGDDTDVDGFSKREREISNISSGQILSFEYNTIIHPRWLTDNNDSGDFWNENLANRNNVENTLPGSDVESDYEDCSPLTIVTEIIDWAPPPDSNDIILDSDIPTFTEEVVTNDYIITEELEEEEFVDETPPPLPPPQKELIKLNKINPRSLLKNNVNFKKPECKFKQTLTVNSSLLKSKQSLLKNTRIADIVVKQKIPEINKKVEVIVKPKFKQTVKIVRNNVLLDKRLKAFGKKKPVRIKKTPVLKKPRKKSVVLDDNITISHEDTESTNNSFISSNMSEIGYKTTKNDSDSDIEIDIETDQSQEDENELIKPVARMEVKIPTILPKPIKEEFEELDEEQVENLHYENSSKDLSQCSEKLREILEDSNDPIEEVKLNPTEITELEMFIHSEFFEGRLTKTPDRYVKIRNHILSSWDISKPAYISKTAIRNGLKNCGDVNCISRIHCLLEQIGAINFGCQGEYFNYIRPLSRLMDSFVQQPRNNRMPPGTSSSLVINMKRRQRIKSHNYSNMSLDSDGNCTIPHQDRLKKSPTVADKSKNLTNWRHEFELVKCKRFSKENIAPFKVSITLSTLLCLQLHSLSSNYEVMGFLGGYRSKTIGRTKICLARYKPCKTAKQSGTMCEMCPVSQVEQSLGLLNEGYDLLGWFHSHPLFPPNPSRTDVNTQAEMQMQFCTDREKPFIGFILGCVDMQYKCVFIMPKDLTSNFQDGIPYELDVDIIKDCTTLSNEIKDVFDIIDKDNNKELLEKFSCAAKSLLTQYGIEKSIFELLGDLKLT